MKTPPISCTAAIPLASSPEGGNVERAANEKPSENSLTEPQRVSIGNGEQRKELIVESESAQLDSPTLPALRPDTPLTAASSQQAAHKSDAQDPPEETRSELLKQLEYRITNFTGPENHQAFLGDQLVLLKEFIQYMAGDSNDQSVPIWMYFSFSDFNRLISQVSEGRLPLGRSKPSLEYRTGSSIIAHEHRKFIYHNKPPDPEKDIFPKNYSDNQKEFRIFQFERNGFNEAYLDLYHDELKANLATGRQSMAFAVDRLLLDDLVAYENKINPGINAYHISDASNFTSTLKDLLATTKAPEASFRFLVCAGSAPLAQQPTKPVASAKYYAREEHVHYCAFDILKAGNHVSILALEPTQLYTLPATIIQSKIRATLMREIPNAKIQFIGLNVQRSDGECHIFCLSFLRKSFKLKDEIRTIHLENIEGKLQTLPAEQLRNRLPPSFMKHTQSKKRIDEYLEINKSRENDIINKNKETLSQRYNNHLTPIISAHQKTVLSSNSIDKKRVAIVEKFVDEVRSRSTHGGL